MVKVLIAFLGAIMLNQAVIPANTVEPVVVIDGRQVPATNENGEAADKYSLDVSPEIISGEAFLPLRLISNYWGSKLYWDNKEKSVRIEYQGSAVTFAIGSSVAYVDGTKTTLEFAPFIRNGRTMVPAGFIEDVYTCDIDFKEDVISISSRHLYIDGLKVAAVQEWTGLIMSSRIYESKYKMCITKLYDLIQSNCIEEIPEPDYYGRPSFGIDIHTYYYINQKISFMKTAGTDGAVIVQYDFYYRENDDPDVSGLMEQQGTDYGKYIVHDYTHDIWYKVSQPDYFRKYRNDIDLIAQWELIFVDDAG